MRNTEISNMNITFTSLQMSFDHKYSALASLVWLLFYDMYLKYTEAQYNRTEHELN